MTGSRRGSRRPHLLLIGGGHATVAVIKAAHSWVQQGVRVTLVSPDRHLAYSGRLPEFVGGVYSADQVAIDLLRLCLLHGVTFVPERVTRLETTAQVALTGGGEQLPFDLAVLDIGLVPNGDEQATDALRVKPMAHLKRLSAWLAGPGGHLLVVGGGLAGVEVLLNAVSRVRERPGFTFTLLHSGSRLMPETAPALSGQALHLLRDAGVQVRLDCRATRASACGVEVDGQWLGADQVAWATGGRGQAWLAQSELPVDEHGLLRVNRDLRVAGHPGVLAAGDTASIAGVPLSRSGVHAVKQGLHLRGVLPRLLHAVRQGRPLRQVALPDFVPYPVSPYLMSTGTPDGWLVLNRHLSGRSPVWLALKHVADSVWMNRYQQDQPGRSS